MYRKLGANDLDSGVVLLRVLDKQVHAYKILGDEVVCLYKDVFGNCYGAVCSLSSYLATAQNLVFEAQEKIPTAQESKLERYAEGHNRS